MKTPRKPELFFFKAGLLGASLALSLSGCTLERWGPRQDLSGALKDARSYDKAEFPGYDAPPRLIEGRAPVYPFSASMANRPGSAKVAFTIGEDGRTRDIQVVEASEPYFGGHTANAIKDWRFEPAHKDGRPVSVRIVQKYSFTPSNGAGQDAKVSGETER